MIVIPAVDIKDGRCVRLYQGREDRETVYGDEPAAMALKWQREGAEYLHVVDLDGAFSGEPQNLESVRKILERVTIPVELGGGLREIESVRRVFKWGVDRVVLGTAAVGDRDFVKRAVGEFGRQVFIGLDAREGKLAVEGWKTDAGIGPLEILGELEEIGVGGVIFTDILTDGALTGPNVESLERILSAARTRVIASGGVSSPEHLKKLDSLQGGTLYGAIIGKALYSGGLTLAEALAAVRRKDAEG